MFLWKIRKVVQMLFAFIYTQQVKVQFQNFFDVIT